MTKLGMGMMRLPLLDENDFKSIDYDEVNKMVDLYMESGFNHLTLHSSIMKALGKKV